MDVISPTPIRTLRVPTCRQVIVTVSRSAVVIRSGTGEGIRVSSPTGGRSVGTPKVSMRAVPVIVLSGSGTEGPLRGTMGTRLTASCTVGCYAYGLLMVDSLPLSRLSCGTTASVKVALSIKTTDIREVEHSLVVRYGGSSSIMVDGMRTYSVSVPKVSGGGTGTVGGIFPSATT